MILIPGGDFARESEKENFENLNFFIGATTFDQRNTLEVLSPIS
jgi:hypothetical protein